MPKVPNQYQWWYARTHAKSTKPSTDADMQKYETH